MWYLESLKVGRLLTDRQSNFTLLVAVFQALLRLSSLLQRVGAVNDGFQSTREHQIDDRGKIAMRTHGRADQAELLAKDEAVVDLEARPPVLPTDRMRPPLRAARKLCG